MKNVLQQRGTCVAVAVAGGVQPRHVMDTGVIVEGVIVTVRCRVCKQFGEQVWAKGHNTIVGGYEKCISVFGIDLVLAKCFC